MVFTKNYFIDSFHSNYDGSSLAIINILTF